MAGLATAGALLAEAISSGIDINFYAGAALIQAQPYGEAIRLLQCCIDNSPKDLNAYLALAHENILSGDFVTGEGLLNHLLVLDPANQTVSRVKQQLAERRKQAQ